MNLPHKKEPASTKFWNPLLFSLFYNKGESFEFLKSLVSLPSSLKLPTSTFLDDEEEEVEGAGIADDEWFTCTEVEVFAL